MMKRAMQLTAILFSLAVTIVIVTGRIELSHAAEDFLAASSAARASISGASTPVPVGRAHNYASDRMKVYVIAPDTLQIYAILANGTGYQAAQFSINNPSLTANPAGQSFSLDKKFSVRVFYMGKNAGGQHLFQVNLYDAGGVLLDDRYTFTRDLAPR